MEWQPILCWKSVGVGADGNINNASLINCLGQVAILTILKHFHILGNFPHNQTIPDSTTTVPCTVSDDDDDDVR